jgi:[ribosomal protein S18]-alanine N-acetyltransferase
MIKLLARLFGRAEATLAEADALDAAALAAIHAASFRRGWSESEFEALLTDRAVVAQRASVGRRVVGFILSRVAADEAEILSVAVGKRQRGHGVGRRLLDLHLGRLAARGVTAVFLEVEDSNVAALRLYRSLGATAVGRRARYYEHGADAAIFSLAL